jgi:hypothetical protein
VTAGGYSPVDLLDLVGGRLPIALGTTGSPQELAAKRGRLYQALELARQRHRIADWEHQAELAVGDQLRVERVLRDDRNRRVGEGGSDDPGGQLRTP